MSALSAEEDACDVPLISPCPAQALYAKYGPVADGALRIPTPEQELVWNKACSDCIMLAQALYAKYGMLPQESADALFQGMGAL